MRDYVTDPVTRSRDKHQKLRLDRLRDSQRSKREWVSVKEVAEFYGRESDPNTIDLKRLESAYSSIYGAVVEGYFGSDRRTSTIRFLAPRLSNEAKLVPARLLEFHETGGAIYVLENSWVRWDAFNSWCDRTNRQELKKHFGRESEPERILNLTADGAEIQRRKRKANTKVQNAAQVVERMRAENRLDERLSDTNVVKIVGDELTNAGYGRDYCSKNTILRAMGRKK